MRYAANAGAGGRVGGSRGGRGRGAQHFRKQEQEQRGLGRGNGGGGRGMRGRQAVGARKGRPRKVRPGDEMTRDVEM